MLKLLNDFVSASKASLDTLLMKLTRCAEGRKEDAVFTTVEKGRRSEVHADGSHFFLRTSTEYSSPQLTLEEIQGIIAARLLESCGNYLFENEVKILEERDLLEIEENLKKPPKGRIFPFMLNADDAEPDRYSNSPLRASIVDSGQSAYPASTVKTSDLRIDQSFVSKYDGSLISKNEVDLIKQLLYSSDRYVDFVDNVKYDSLDYLSQSLGIDLILPMIRMPLEILKNEKCGDPLHILIQGSHTSYETIETIYGLMGRSMKKKTTLLTAPHSKKGYGSKRSAKGKLVFNENTLQKVDVKYQKTQLYPNMADPNDICFAEGDDSISVEAKDLAKYDYAKTPSSPQFALYVLLSPENASLAHGVGAYAGSEIVKSYCSVYGAYIRGIILKEMPQTNLCKEIPLALNLIPDKMWLHPEHKNIDASMGCFKNPLDLLEMGMAIEALDFKQEVDARLTKSARALTK